MASPKTHNILLLGAGELGTAFLNHLSTLPNTHITLAVRTPSKYSHFMSYSNVSPLALDTNGPSSELSKTFSEFDTLISATGFGQPVGTVTKLAEEVLAAGEIKKEKGQGALWFFPWQWGVDYDVTGDGEGLMPLFGEQRDVRNLLRSRAAESNVKWTIVSTGIFMSFLFEPFWGVVDRSGEQQGKGVKVNALRNWEHKVTVTDVDDIGKVLARIVAGDLEAKSQVVYIAGDTVSYGRLATIIERVTQNPINREEWTMSHLEEELAEDPEDGIKKYRLVFARDGVWWDKEHTVNHRLGIPLMDVEAYAEKLFSKDE